MGFTTGTPVPAAPMKATVDHRREVRLHADHPQGVMPLHRSTTTGSRSFHNELCGRLERRKRQLVALDARNPANELSDVLVIQALAQRQTFAH